MQRKRTQKMRVPKNKGEKARRGGTIARSVEEQRNKNGRK